MHQNIHFRWHTAFLNLEVNFVTLLWISLLMTLSLCLSAAAHTWNWVFALQMGMFVQFIFFMYYSVFRCTKDKIANIRIQKTDGKTFLISITAESRRVSWVKKIKYIYIYRCVFSFFCDFPPASLVLRFTYAVCLLSTLFVILMMIYVIVHCQCPLWEKEE